MALVLVVEDELSIAKLLEEVLTDEGHRVLIAGNGRQALAIVANETPAVVLTDFMMPVMDGAALVSALSQNDIFRRIPVIVMSSLPEDTVATRVGGYASFIRKPFKIMNVIDVVERALGGSGS